MSHFLVWLLDAAGSPGDVRRVSPWMAPAAGVVERAKDETHFLRGAGTEECLFADLISTDQRAAVQRKRPFLSIGAMPSDRFLALRDAVAASKRLSIPLPALSRLGAQHRTDRHDIYAVRQNLAGNRSRRPAPPRMKFDEPREIEGMFWLPGTEQRFYGRIMHGPDGTRMHLVNSTVIAGYGGTPISSRLTLHGDTDAGRVSVLDLHPLTWSTRGDGANTIDCLVETVVVGDHIDDLRMTEIRVGTISLHGLQETLTGAWPEPGLLSPRGAQAGHGEGVFWGLHNGAQLAFEVGELTNLHHGVETPFIYAHARWTLPEPWTFAEFEEHLASPLRDLVQFCTRRASYVNSLTLYRTQDLGGQLNVLQAPYPRPDEHTSRDVQALLINLRDLEDPAAVISRWFSLSREVGPVWPIFFAALRGTGLLEDRFLSLVAFAEGFHRARYDEPPLSKEEEKVGKKLVSDALRHSPKVRRVFKEALGHANSQSLRDRLAFFTEQAAALLDTQIDSDLFCAQVVHTRNWMVHWGDPGKHIVTDTPGLSQLVRQLELVLSTALMKEIGLTDSETATAVGSGWRFEGLP